MTQQIKRYFIPDYEHLSVEARLITSEDCCYTVQLKTNLGAFEYLKVSDKGELSTEFKYQKASTPLEYKLRQYIYEAILYDLLTKALLRGWVEAESVSLYTPSDLVEVEDLPNPPEHTSDDDLINIVKGMGLEYLGGTTVPYDADSVYINARPVGKTVTYGETKSPTIRWDTGSFFTLPFDTK